jgi:hypothetical protein
MLSPVPFNHESSPENGSPNTQGGGWSAVAHDVFSGVGNEIANNKGKLLTNAAIGVAALAAPEVALAVGVPLAAYEWYKHSSGNLLTDVKTAAQSVGNYAGDLLHNASVVANNDDSKHELSKAHTGLQQFGGDATEVAAMGVGSVGGSFARPTVQAALRPVENTIARAVGEGASSLAAQASSKLESGMAAAKDKLDTTVAPAINSAIETGRNALASGMERAAPKLEAAKDATIGALATAGTYASDMLGTVHRTLDPFNISGKYISNLDLGGLVQAKLQAGAAGLSGLSQRARDYFGSLTAAQPLDGAAQVRPVAVDSAAHAGGLTDADIRQLADHIMGQARAVEAKTAPSIGDYARAAVDRLRNPSRYSGHLADGMELEGHSRLQAEILLLQELAAAARLRRTPIAEILG